VPIDRCARALLAAALALAASPASACGYCVEDRVAAVYDHEVVEAAKARKGAVAFFAVEGGPSAGAAARRALVAALESAGGIKGSARVALENAACSVAYDPARVSPAQIAARAGKPLAAKGIALTALRVTGGDGELRQP
jgi:hypothetical protein